MNMKYQPITNTLFCLSLATMMLSACDADDSGDSFGNPTLEGGEEEGGGEVTPKSVIDDFEDGDGGIIESDGRIGYWYTYNDETEGGTQTPASGANFEPIKGDAASGSYFAQTTGSGFTEWGAGFGFDFNNPGDERSRGVYDVSSYEGVTFMAKGNISIRVVLPTMAVIPQSQDGNCDEGDGSETLCDDAHGKDIPLSSEWKRYTIAFDEVAQQGWGTSSSWDPSSVVGFQIQMAEGMDFDVAIDDLAFY